MTWSLETAFGELMRAVEAHVVGVGARTSWDVRMHRAVERALDSVDPLHPGRHVQAVVHAIQVHRAAMTAEGRRADLDLYLGLDAFLEGEARAVLANAGEGFLRLDAIWRFPLRDGCLSDLEAMGFLVPGIREGGEVVQYVTPLAQGFLAMAPGAAIGWRAQATLGVIGWLRAVCTGLARPLRRGRA